MAVTRLINAALSDPLEVCLRMWDKFQQRNENRRRGCPYVPDLEWESRLREALGSVGPDDDQLTTIWADIERRLRAAGIEPGPASYAGHNDGDRALIRAIWTLLRSLRPAVVVETGVAHGVTTRFILEGLRHNGLGQLHSIDLPPLTITDVHDRVGIAVDAQRDHWHYIRGSSLRRLRPLLRSLGTIDLFVHDSLHTEYNMRFEMCLAWRHLRAGGAMVVDDIDNNWAFHDFSRAMTVSGQASLTLTCLADPVRVDPLRHQRGVPGLFGVMIKSVAD